MLIDAGTKPNHFAYKDPAKFLSDLLAASLSLGSTDLWIPSKIIDKAYTADKADAISKALTTYEKQFYVKKTTITEKLLQTTCKCKSSDIRALSLFVGKVPLKEVI